MQTKYLLMTLSFWVGVGLMSIINVWKISQNQHAISYLKIMFGVFYNFYYYLCDLNKNQEVNGFCSQPGLMHRKNFY